MGQRFMRPSGDRQTKPQHTSRQRSLRRSVDRPLDWRLVIRPMERLGVGVLTSSHLTCCSPAQGARSPVTRSYQDAAAELKMSESPYRSDAC